MSGNIRKISWLLKALKLENTLPTRAWDMVSDPDLDIRSSEAAGWLFGTPPGIKPEQWPLNPNTGYPLQHGFTLLLPEEYRVRGKDIVAISFFGEPPEHCAGGPLVNDGARDLVLGLDEPLDSHEPSKLLAQLAAKSHPQLHRFKDILDGAFAIIDLTQEEFDGPLCELPDLCHHPMFSDLPRPVFATPDAPAPVAIRLTLRKDDPNVGVKPVEFPKKGDLYQEPYDPETDDVINWAKALGEHHIGGTAMPCQAYPDLSPFYIEFSESFGGFNFGDDGNAQLCLKTLTFDWACA